MSVYHHVWDAAHTPPRQGGGDDHEASETCDSAELTRQPLTVGRGPAEMAEPKFVDRHVCALRCLECASRARIVAKRQESKHDHGGDLAILGGGPHPNGVS